MSGSGGSFYYTPSFKKKEEMSCDLLKAETTLCNPNEDLLLKVKVGDILPVASDGSTLTGKMEFSLEDIERFISNPNIIAKDRSNRYFPKYLRIKF